MTETFHDLRSQRVDTAIAEYLEAIEEGAPPERAAFLALHSDIEAELREFIADYQALEQAAPRHPPETTDAALGILSGPLAKFAALALPCRFGQFELLEEIARGGMGVVYKAQQRTPHRLVALKMILAGRLASRAEVDRFYAEAQAAATLDHPNIVPVFEVGEFEGQLYFTMGFVAGQSVAERVAHGPLPPEESAAIVRDAATAVHYAHQKGIIHRDLKPANILLDGDGRVRVTDFGLAKRQTDATGLTCTGQLLGTPSFMPPEQIAGRPSDIGPASDVYSLGATLYTLLTGRPPFQAASVADTLRQVAEKEPLSPRELNIAIPRNLETIALKCLEKSPGRRYVSAQAVADDLERFLTDQPISARRATQAERLLRWCRHKPAVAGLTGAVAMLLVAAVAILAVSNAQIRHQSDARARALTQKDAALITARKAVDQMLTEVANKKFSDVPIAHPLRVALLTDALEFYEGLAPMGETNASLGQQMAQVLDSMSALQRELGLRDDAIRSLRRGIQLLETSQDRNSPAVRERMGKMELSLAYTMGESIHSSRADDPAVEAQYRRALAQLRDLERRWPERRQPYVICLRYLAERAFQRSDREEAQQLWKEAIASGEGYLDQQPRDVDTRVSLCWGCIEYYNRLFREDPERQYEAEVILQTGLRHAKIALDVSPKAAQARDVAASINLSLGTWNCRAGRPGEAIALYKEAVGCIESLCADFPWTADYWDSVQWFHDDISANLRDQGRLKESQEALRAFSMWLGAISPKLPDEPGPQKLLRQTRVHLVEQLRAAGLPQDADNLARLHD